MAQAAPGKRPNWITVMFRATARPFSYIFPGVVSATLVMSVFSFRISHPGAEAGFGIGLYVLAVFYFGGMFARKTTFYGLITLAAVPVLFFFISIKTYWPLMITAVLAINKAFKDRELDFEGKIVSSCLGAFLILAFIPAAILSCDAYHSNYASVKQSNSPDGRYMVEVRVLIDSPLGGRGKAALYEKYPLLLERKERDLAAWKWIPLDTTHRPGYVDTHAVGIPMEWKDGSTIVMGELTMDVHQDPEFIEKDE